MRALQLGAAGARGPYTYASTPRALYNNAKLRRDPSCGGGLFPAAGKKGKVILPNQPDYCELPNHRAVSELITSPNCLSDFCWEALSFRRLTAEHIKATTSSRCAASYADIKLKYTSAIHTRPTVRELVGHHALTLFARVCTNLRAAAPRARPPEGRACLARSCYKRKRILGINGDEYAIRTEPSAVHPQPSLRSCSSFAAVDRRPRARGLRLRVAAADAGRAALGRAPAAMPALQLAAHAFTVISGSGAPPPPVARRVLAVRPQQRPAAPDAHFARALDLKLRRLKQRERLAAGQRRADADRPRFVTTVKTGQFLLPPPGAPAHPGLHALYAAREPVVYEYASRPKPVAARARRSLPGSGDRVPNGAPVALRGDEPSPSGPGMAFRGVRALIAGVAGVRRLLERRDCVLVLPYSNLMHDKRVVRGSTFGSHPQAAGDAPGGAARSRRLRARRPGRATTPPPAPGRRHLRAQTDHYLEELFAKGQELEAGVQTELSAERPATPAYAPAASGADAHTQIYAGDLFDFELEVQPLLEQLVGGAARQALAEAAQEEELAALREQQRRFRELRDAELAERQRLAAQHARLAREKARRAGEARAARAAGEQARARAAGAALVRGYVAELLPSLLAGLRDAGHLLRRLQTGVEEEFMPWLVDEVSHEIESIITSRDVLTDIVRGVLAARAQVPGAPHSPPASPSAS
ncbi:radial spoke head protein 3 homolog A, partial [Pararge aegeria]|uniref:radial spoke head protein 3 homolog A n=1 Tax=Pararge aegeria TaxID=116150 RepID=UPI0019D252EE